MSEFIKSLEAFSNESKNGEILVFYGVGGIGKTKLIRKLYEETDQILLKSEHKTTINKVHISLDAYDYSNPVNVLMNIRKQLSISCPLFDYALLAYSVKTKQNAEDVSRRFSGLKGPVFDIINELISLGMGSVSIPSNILRKAADLVSDIHIKMKFKEEVEAINGYTESEIYQRLPYYLGISINHAAEKGTRHVIFIDSYESLLLRVNDTALIEDSKEWLKELFLASEKLLIVIGSREKIKWYEDVPEWNNYLNQHILERLSDEDSYYFLDHVPIPQKDIQKAIVESAHGVPLYLDMCVDLYENALNNNMVLDTAMFSIPTNKIINRYIRHLKANEKNAIRLLSVLDFFSNELALFILVRENLFLSEDELDNLFEKSIFVLLDEHQYFYKIDESVRHHLQKSLDPEKKRIILNHAMEYVKQNMKQSPNTCYRIFMRQFRIIADDTVYFEQSIQDLVQIMVSFVDLGYWSDIHRMAAPYLNSGNSCIRAFAIFAELFYLRITSRIPEAQKFMEENKIDSRLFKGYGYLYEFLKIHIIHLSGRYDEALDSYKELLSRIEPIKESLDSHIYITVSLKYTDLLFLKGHFKTSLEMSKELAGTADISAVDKIKLLRIRGHIYRFNFMLEQALDIYHSAMDLLPLEKSLSYEGKIYTNLAESCCYSDPVKALEYANKSIEINGKIDSIIEIGKAYTAAAISCAMLQRFEDAVQYAKKGIEAQEKTGYRSGVLFAKIALYLSYLLGKTADEKNIESLLNNIYALQKELNVYSFLLLPIHVINGDSNAIESLRVSTEWLNFDRTLKTLKDIFHLE